MKWRGGSGGCDNDVDGGVSAVVMGGGEGGDGVGLVAARGGACTRCLSGLRGLHYLLDKVVQAGMYRDLSLRTSGPLQDPTTATLTTITITNGDGMPRVGTFRETISPK
ncbi:hypothetical protein Tco_0800268 [Tanacetum coccineum]|uniref:Uncharacterized protein n=1 Tax=Tanacetum coccineum TaxID=301880 RepID=A0ABQ4ZSM6_9ASTR